MNPQKPGYIEKKTDPVLSFDSLRQEGIALLQQLSGSIWTDYNLHDPGITILEQLCFAITDLIYRGNFSIEEILAEKDGTISYRGNSFLDARKMLSSNPVTINDFRKIILDGNSDVENVWLEPANSYVADKHIGGVYSVKLKLKEYIFKEADNAKRKKIEAGIKKDVTAILNSHRNICEKFDEIFILKAQKIKLKATILIKNNIVPEEVLADVYLKAIATLYPTITFHKDADLQLKGYQMADIYTGPLLKNGIILDEELKPLQDGLDVSEFTNAFLQLNEVLHIKSVTISAGDETDLKYCPRDADSVFVLDDSTFETDISLVNNNYTLSINSALYKSFLKKKTTHSNAVSRPKEASAQSVKVPYKNIGRYYSIQNHFPQIYGIGEDGLEIHANNKRRAEAHQLKAYLMVFEQLLANHLAQLDSIKRLFSVENVNEHFHTMFSQPLYDVPRAREVIKALSPSSEPDRPDWETAKSILLHSDWDAIQRILGHKDWEALQRVFRKGERIRRIATGTDWEKLKEAIESTGWETAKPALHKAEWETLEKIFRNINLNTIQKAPNDYIKDIQAALESGTENRERKNTIVEHLLARYNEMVPEYAVLSFNKTYYHAHIKDHEKDIVAHKSVYFHHLESFGLHRTTVSNAAGNDHLGFLEKKLYLLLNIRQCSEDADGNINFAHIDKMQSRQLTDAFSVKGKHQVGATRPSQSVWATTHSFTFSGQPLSFFKEALKAGNYTIDHNSIFYTSGSSNLHISSHGSLDEANNALHALIRYLTILSINSEGFHIVEHILLAPELKDAGFSLRYSWDSLTGRTHASKDDMTFADREKEITSIRKKGLTADPEGADIRFEMFVNLPDGTHINEEFFDLQMTVVLPSWPARFQDRDFRQYIIRIFQLNMPAHLHINFKWLDIADMHRFEKIYFKWREGRQDFRQDENLHLIRFLGKNHIQTEHL